MLEGKIPLVRHRRRLEDNIKMDVTETGFRVVDWIYVARNRDRWGNFVKTVTHFMIS